MGAFVLTTSGLGYIAGLDIETDPRSSDYLKQRSGKTRLDFGGGFFPYVVASARLITGESKSPASGAVSSLTEGYKAPGRVGVVGNLLRNKLSPMVGFAYDLLQQKDFKGDPIEYPEAVVDLFVPMVVQDFTDIYKEEGISKLPLGAFGFIGAAVQSFDAPDSK